MWVQLILTLIIMYLVLSDSINQTNDNNVYKVAILTFTIFAIKAWKKLTTRPDGRFILDIPQKHHI